MYYAPGVVSLGDNATRQDSLLKMIASDVKSTQSHTMNTQECISTSWC